jgi:hypothetical protein
VNPRDIVETFTLKHHPKQVRATVYTVYCLLAVAVFVGLMIVTQGWAMVVIFGGALIGLIWSMFNNILSDDEDDT